MMAEFLKQLEFCPACRQGFDDHQISMLASAPIKASSDVSSDSSSLAFLQAIKNHDWANVLGFQDWEGGFDDYELYAIRAAAHPLVLVTVLDPVELFFKEKVIDTEILNKTDSDELLSLAAEKKWHSPSDIV